MEKIKMTNKRIVIAVSSLLMLTIIIVGIHEYSLSRYNAGYKSGKSDGYDIGQREGYKKGYDEGYDEGHSEGYDEGYEIGFDEGQGYGYRRGYINGSYYIWP